jgi:hypothetical protein
MNSMSVDVSRSKPTFGGHEKFVFRHGWLKKGIEATLDDAAIFSHDQALVTLGVGKNMVRSIRHWCLATTLLEPMSTTGRVTEFRPTLLGRALLTDGGWDPYCEDLGTLWLLHWLLVSNHMRALVWHLTFTTYFEGEFTKRQLSDFITRQLEKLDISTTPAMIEREVDACLRTYLPGMRRAAAGVQHEESLDCPLAELDILRYSADDNIYQFNVGPKPTLPVALFGYALLSFWPSIAQSRQTAAVDECIYRPHSPGQAFKLDENSVVEYLERLEELTQGTFRLQETAGIRQIYASALSPKQIERIAVQLLQQYYRRNLPLHDE